jgi:Tol biopolymer transport system component
VLLPPRITGFEAGRRGVVEPEALIEEARRRARRRRLGLSVLVLAASSALAALIVQVTAGSSRSVVSVPSGGPVVNLAAFAHRGELAFVSRDRLWVVDGARRTLRPVTASRGLHPLAPMFSPDGRWLAFLETSVPPAEVAAGAPGGQVWLARADGDGAHPIAGLRASRLVGWSSRSDILAVIAGPLSGGRPPYGEQTTLRLVVPNGSMRTLVTAPAVKSAVWSTDGRQLAVGTENHRLVDTVATYAVAGGPATVWARFRERERLNGMNEILVDIAGWWPGYGIGIWVYGDGMVHNNDRTPLDLIARPGATPRLVAQTLSDRTTRIFVWGGDRLALVADVTIGGSGGNRVEWDHKQVQLCAPGGGCRSLVPDRSKVTVDPAWSPDGRMLALVEAPDLAFGGWPQALLRRWYDDHELRLYDARTGRLRTVASARGVSVPQWSPDGRSLLYVARDGLWLLPTITSRPVEIARPLFAPGAWPAYYGQMAWPAQFGWWSP